MANNDKNGDVDKEEKEEILHYMTVVNAFKAYRNTTLRALDECVNGYNSLPEAHKEMIPKHKRVLEELKVCVDHNAAVIKEITRYCSGTFENKHYKDLAQHVPHTSADSEKVVSTLKQIVRDWSDEGIDERKSCYDPIIKEITSRLPPSRIPPSSRETLLGQSSDLVKVLVPGCGLGRLPWELAKRGYYCQGNEFSFYMLFTSNFIINKTQIESNSGHHQFTIYPWVGKRCNNLSWDDVLRPVKFPDVNPGDIPMTNSFSMAAGDFMEIYTTENSWDCVACCFFIDTAKNIISYIERIFHILTPGGLFISLGPLLYHFFGISNEPSIELSYEEVVEVVKKIGFNILNEDRQTCLYTHHPNSMLSYEYRCVLLVAQKPNPPAL